MDSHQIDSEEVVLDERDVSHSIAKGTLKMTLTSKRLVFEKAKGLVKKELVPVASFPLEEVKFFNGKPQIKQRGKEVTIQAESQNCTIVFSNMLDAGMFATKAKNAVTGTTVAERGAEMAKSAFDVVDDTLGIDVRGTIKGVMQGGIKGALWNGIGRER